MTAETTGLEYVYDGTTTEIPSPGRSSYQPDRYGQRWAPIVVGWTSGAPFSITSEVKGARAIAAGGSVYEFNEEGLPVYVTGLGRTFDANAELRPAATAAAPGDRRCCTSSATWSDWGTSTTPRR